MIKIQNKKSAVYTICFLLILFFSPLLFAGGASESAAAAGGGRGKYLAGQGIIIPPDEVYIDSYIASVDYKYPNPVDPIGISMYSGHYQISASGQEEIIHIGIQGQKKEFVDLTPLNIAFVIDKSGSMNEQDKMGWVKDAFDIFIKSVREKDYVALVVFDNEAEVVFPSTRMDTAEKRNRFRNAVHGVMPDGGTNLSAGLELGYQQILANFRNEYTNRVLFLTDGVGDSAGILDMAESYKEIGINVSTIGVGTNFDLDLMASLAKKGGGSSRFIADREEMEEIFGSELSRMVAPIARNLKMTLEFPQNTKILDTWGYFHKISASSIEYSQATLHLGDYETILAQIEFPEQSSLGEKELARFTVNYEDLEGVNHISGPHILKAEFVDVEFPVTGFSSGMVLQSGTMLHLAQNLIRIGSIYYSIPEWQENIPQTELKQALDLTIKTKKEVSNARLRLDEIGFDDEIIILDKYIQILGGDLELAQEDVDIYRRDNEIKPPVQERSLFDHLTRLFKEITLDLSKGKSGVVAISGFTSNKEEDMQLLDLLDEMAVTEISKLDTMTLVDRNNIDEVLEEQKLSLSALMDTTTAIEIGKLLTANYIITGSVINMPKTVVVFGRVINTETAEIESAAQVIMPKAVIDEL